MKDYDYMFMLETINDRAMLFTDYADQCVTLIEENYMDKDKDECIRSNLKDLCTVRNRLSRLYDEAEYVIINAPDDKIKTEGYIISIQISSTFKYIKKIINGLLDLIKESDMVWEVIR